MHCILTSSIEYQQLKKQYFSLSEEDLKAIIAVWQEDNGLDNWPTNADIEPFLPLVEQATFFQETEELPMSAASTTTLNKVKEAAKKMGIDIQKLSDYLKGNPNIPSGINALADLVKGVIAIAEGKEEVALTEEFVHVATAMLEQTHPAVMTEMIAKIGKFKIYQQVYDAYKDNKFYQTPEGKPDIRKIKKEAVDKLIAELIIKQNEGSNEFPELFEEANKSLIRTWWNKILGFISADYKKSNIILFEEVAEQLISTPSVESKQDVVFGFNTKDTKQLKFQTATIHRINSFLEAIGVSQRLVPSILAKDGSIVKGAIAAANFIDATIDIVDDIEERKEAWDKLPEEAAHWWYRLLKLDSPMKMQLWLAAKDTELYKKLIATNYGNYNDIDTLTEEAVGQLIAQAMNKPEQTFWEKFVQWLKNLLSKVPSVEVPSIFNIAAEKLLLSDLSDLMTLEEYYALQPVADFVEENSIIDETVGEIANIETSGDDVALYMDYLRTKVYKKRSKFLKKTLEKIQSSSSTLTHTFSSEEKNKLTSVILTFRAKDLLLVKFRSSKISLADPIKLDGAKQEELVLLNKVKQRIKEENPELRSISAEDLIQETELYINTVYNLTSKNLSANKAGYWNYRVNSTFTDTTDVEHNKIGFFLNHKYFTEGHFPANPFAWYNITPFNFKTIDHREDLTFDGSTGMIYIKGELYATAKKNKQRTFDLYFPSGNIQNTNETQITPVLHDIRAKLGLAKQKLCSVLLHEFQTDILDVLEKRAGSVQQEALSFLLKSDKYFEGIKDAIKEEEFTENVYRRFLHTLEELGYRYTEENAEYLKNHLQGHKENTDYHYNLWLIFKDLVLRKDEDFSNILIQLYEQYKKLKNQYPGKGNNSYFIHDVFIKNPELIQQIGHLLHTKYGHEWTHSSASVIESQFAIAVKGVKAFNAGFFLAGFKKNLILVSRREADRANSLKKKASLEYFKFRKGYEKFKKIQKLSREDIEELFYNLKHSYNNLLMNLELNGDQAVDEVAQYKQLATHYLVPLLTDAIIRAKKETTDIRFTGGAATLLTQGNSVTAELYAGPEEVEKNKELKREWLYSVMSEHLTQTGISDKYKISPENTYDELRKVFIRMKKKEGIYAVAALYDQFLKKSGGKFMEVGYIYSQLSKLKGVSLSYESTEGLKNNTPTYKINTEGFNLTNPVLYAIKEATEDVPVVEEPSTEGIFFQIPTTDKQKQEQRKILETRNIIEKVEAKETPDPMFLDTEEANNWYVRKSDGKRVKHRVTDRVKAWYKDRFWGKTFTKEEIAFNNFKREFGIKGHNMLQEIHSRFFDAYGVKREQALPSPTIDDPVDADIYAKLEEYFTDLMERHTIDGVPPIVFAEEIIYDNREDEAGTLDLLVIDANGKGKIYDWKFMDVSKSRSEDLPWFKFGAFNIQLKRYREILQNRYGIKEVDVNRAIPILMDVHYNIKTKKHEIKGIAIGTADPTKITDVRLVPVSEEAESTGEKALDRMIQQLNAMLKQVTTQKVSDEEEKELKFERLTLLRKAIHVAQGAYNIAPLVEVVDSTKREGMRLINKYKNDFKDKDPKDFKNKELSEFADELRQFLAEASILEDVAYTLGDLIYNEQMEKDANTEEQKEYVAQAKELLNTLKQASDNIKSSRIEITSISKEFADRFIGIRNLIAGLLNPEAVVSGLASLFRGVSEISMKSAQLVYKMVSIAKGKAVLSSQERVDKILEIRKRIVDKGGDVRAYIQQLYQKTEKGEKANKLIHRYDAKFFEELKNNALPGAQKKEWIKDNIDLDAYTKEAEKRLRDRIAYLKEIETDEEELSHKIDAEERKYDVTRQDFNGWNNGILHKHPLPKWESAEYLKIKRDPDLFELYTLITELNKDATECGYIDNKYRYTFLPFIRKGMAESMAWDFSISAIMNISDTFKMNPDDVGYGTFNHLTGEMENSIPRYFTYDFTRTETGDIDFSEVSEDLFKNLILYTVHMEKYKYLSEIEGQINMIKKVESLKGHLNTSRIGNVISTEPYTSNAENTKLLDDYIKVLLYDQRYPLSPSDIPLETGKIKRGVMKLLYSIAGKKYVDDGSEPSMTSVNKTIDAVNKGFQLKTLGFEMLSGVANFFGVNIQISTQAGVYFKAREVAKNGMKLMQNTFKNDDEREMFIQMLDVFMPLKDDPTYDKIKEAGLTKLTRQNFSDILMVFMRLPEQHAEKSIFLSLLDNMMVVDGKIVSIPKYVKSKYKDRTTSAARYQETQKLIENEIESLKKTSSISVTKKLENGKLVIPGLDLTNKEEILRLTLLARRISRNATGGISDADINRMSMNIWTKSMMVFKMWIPKLIDTRFAEFRKTSDDFSVEMDEEGKTIGEQYDVGRIRLFANLFFSTFADRSNNILNIMQMNEAGLKKLDALFVEYALDYKKRTGEDLNMTPEEFVDLIRTNLRNQLKELAILTTLFGVMFALTFVPDDEDDRATKNFHRYVTRGVDKMINELMFFYNPLEMQKLLSGSMFPAIGLVTDMLRFMSHVSMELTGIDFTKKTPEEVRKRAQPIKNFARMMPVTKPAFVWGSMLSDEFAKEFDITLQNQATRW